MLNTICAVHEDEAERSELIGLQLKVNNNDGSCVGSSTTLDLSDS